MPNHFCWAARRNPIELRLLSIHAAIAARIGVSTISTGRIVTAAACKALNRQGAKDYFNDSNNDCANSSQGHRFHARSDASKMSRRHSTMRHGSRDCAPPPNPPAPPMSKSAPAQCWAWTHGSVSHRLRFAFVCGIATDGPAKQKCFGRRDLRERGKLPRQLSFQCEHTTAFAARSFRLWIYTLTHVVRIVLGGTQDHVPHLNVLFHDGTNVSKSPDVVAGQYLAVTMRTGADADGQNMQPGRDGLGNRIRNSLELRTRFTDPPRRVSSPQ